jgi:hypothetical protein
VSKQTIQEHLANAVKDAPPFAVGGLTLFGVTLSDWVLILTAIYTIIRIVAEIRQWRARKQDDSRSTILDSRSTDGTNK